MGRFKILNMGSIKESTGEVKKLLVNNIAGTSFRTSLIDGKDLSRAMEDAAHSMVVQFSLMHVDPTSELMVLIEEAILKCAAEFYGHDGHNLKIKVIAIKGDTTTLATDLTNS